MALSVVHYLSNGSQREYAVPFTALDRDFVKAFSSTVDPEGVAVGERLPLAFEWLNDGLIQLADVVPAGQRITIERNTPTEQTLADYQGGSFLEEDELNIGVTQALHAVQEVKDQTGGSIGDLSVHVERTTEAAKAAAIAAEKSAQEASLAAVRANEQAADAVSSANAAVRAAESKADKIHATAHLTGGSDPIPEATPSRGGLMSPEYAAKLDGLFPTGAQNFYVDPDGDTSINTPGTVDAPFKSPRIALDILSSRQLSSPYDITINVRPGNYGSENADFGSHIFSEKGLIIRGVDSNNLQPPDSVDPDTLPKWNINTNLAFSGPQIVSIRDLDITLAQTVAINRTASLNLQRTIRFTKTNADNNNFLSAGDYGCIFISGNLTVDFNNTSALAFATAWYYSRITFEAQTKLHTLNLTSTVRTLSAERYSEIFFNNGTTWTYDSPVGYTGFKYQIYFWTFLRLNGLGVNFIPGAIAGTAEETCLLWT